MQLIGNCCERFECDAEIADFVDGAKGDLGAVAECSGLARLATTTTTPATPATPMLRPGGHDRDSGRAASGAKVILR
jgi:hypothetical protein